MSQYVFGIDIGGTTVKCGLFSLAGEILDKWEIPTTLGSILEDTAQTILDKAAAKNIAKDQIKGIGVGVPGPVTADGVVIVGVNIGWPDPKDVKGEMEKLTGLPVAVANDANVAALGEAWTGAAKGAKNAIMYTLGTGVGGGVIVDGKVIAGTHGAGGELGHATVILEGGTPCGCGKTGCLETVTSATGIVRETKKYLAANQDPSSLRDVENLQAKDIFDAAKANDAVALKMVDQVGYYFGFAVSHTASATDPEKIIIGGGVSKAGQILIDAIQKYYRQFAFSSIQDTEFVIAELGNDAGIIGAASLAL